MSDSPRQDRQVRLDLNYETGIAGCATVPAMTALTKGAFLSTNGVLVGVQMLASAAQIEPPPNTDKVPVIDKYHGELVTDNYQWLEKSDDPKVKEWTQAQTERTRHYLDSIPEREMLLSELKHAILGKTIRYGQPIFAGGKVFATKFEPPKPQPFITARNSPFSDDEQVVFDPAKADPAGLTSFDWYRPSPDGSIIAIALSRAGSEAGTLHFIQVSDGKVLDEQVARVQYPTAGGSVAWDTDGKGVFYTRFPRKGERSEGDLNFYQQIYYHTLGTPDSEDRYEIGKEFPRIAEIKLDRSPNGQRILASVANGDGGEYAHYLRSQDGKWTQLTDFGDGVKQAVFAGNDKILLRSIKNAPLGQVLRLQIHDQIDTIREAKLAVPQSQDSAIQKIAGSDTDILVDDIVGGPSRLRHFDITGKSLSEVPLPPLAGVGSIAVTEDGKFVVGISKYTKPAIVVVYDPKTGDSKESALSAKLAVNFDDIEEREEFATARDGTRIPVIILMRKGTELNGANPTILNGYGSYGISNTPDMNIFLRPMFNRGAIFAIANVRGGGEYGEPWHQAGALTRKQTTIDDFAAAAQMLADKKYTEPRRLGVMGGSAGGITVGGFLTRYPERAQAACSIVGVLDTLRTELEPNGEFNTTEFGSTKDPEQFRALLGYSPYANVKDGVKYPAVLLMTGENDHRVASWHSKKMAARLQAATASDNPILLRVSTTAGHGVGTAFEERLNERADQFAFFYDQLGMEKSEKP